MSGSILGVGQQDANNPAAGKGGSGALGGNLAKMDPIGNFITGIGGDPLNLYGNKNNPGAWIFPSGQNGANGTNGTSSVPSVLPNLGASSLIPQMPQGAFQNFNGGPGIYNQMAAQSMGGQMFNPGAQSKGGQSIQAPMNQMPQGAGIRQMMPLGNFGVPRGYQQR